MSKRVVITGAFSYLGAAVAHEMMQQGWHIHALTNRKPSANAVSKISNAPLLFEPSHLVQELTGADVLVNTYWIRFPHGKQTFDLAVKNTTMFFEAARKASVKRIVHVSVSNADLHSALDYYRCKAQLETILKNMGIAHAIVKPTLIVGPGDILTNNIAWFLRQLPIFGLPSGGEYRLQPITLADCGKIVAEAASTPGNLDWDAAGPEIFAFKDFVSTVALACGVGHRRLIPVPDWFALAALWGTGLVLRDKVLTRQELKGLAEERLISHKPPQGKESVRTWLQSVGPCLGKNYHNDLARHFGVNRNKAIVI